MCVSHDFPILTGLASKRLILAGCTRATGEALARETYQAAAEENDEGTLRKSRQAARKLGIGACRRSALPPSLFLRTDLASG